MPQHQAAAAPAALQRMLTQLPVCQKDAVFLASLGQLMNSQERYLEAADHLERALMLDPDLKDAQLSYAVALAGSGDVVSAQALLDNLLSDVDLPAELRPLIARQKALLASGGAPADPHTWQKRFSLSTRVGYDTNLLGSPNLASLALTLSGQTLVLPLDDTYLARPAAYTRADVQVELSRTAPDGARWDAIANLRGRNSPALPAAGSTQVDLLLERSNFVSYDTPGKIISTMSSGSYFNASLSALDSNSGTRFMAWGVGGGWGAAWRSPALGACQARTGLEWQERKYLDNQVLSGRYTGLTLNGSCESNSGALLLLGLKVGHDQAYDASRPGDGQNQTTLRMGTFVPVASLGGDKAVADRATASGTRRNGFLLDIERTNQLDSNGYSPIIDSGRSREVYRSAAKIEYQHFFSRDVQLVFGLEWVEQTSNIDLFGLSSRGIYSGLRFSR